MNKNLFNNKSLLNLSYIIHVRSILIYYKVVKSQKLCASFLPICNQIVFPHFTEMVRMFMGNKKLLRIKFHNKLFLKL